MKRYWIALTIGAALSLVARDQAHAFDDLLGDPVVAKGDGFEIRQSLVDERYFLYNANLAARGRQLNENQKNAIEKQLIEKLVTHRLLARRATAEDKAKAREAADRLLQEAVKNAGSPASYRRQLIAVGMNEEQFKVHLMENALSEAVIERELMPSISVSDDQIQSFYENNLSLFTEEEKARMSYIFISTRDSAGNELSDTELEEKTSLAQKILARIQRGEDFFRLKKEYNEDYSVAGQEDVIVATRGQLYPSLASAAFSTQPGNVSDIVEVSSGFYIIKLHEILPEKTEPFDAAKDRVREMVINAELHKRLPAHIEKLKVEADVEFIDPS